MFSARLVHCLLYLIGTGMPAIGMMERSDFEEVNQTIINSYAPLVAHNLGAKLKLREIWHGFGSDFQVDSVLKTMSENRFLITLTGNAPQNPYMSMDGYAIIACHEIGHIMGSGPKQSPKLVQWSSNEGDADYYSTNECMWRYVALNQPKHIISGFDRQNIRRCEQSYGSQQELFSCLRILAAIRSMQDYFNNTTSINDPVSIHRQDKSVVRQTLEKFPSNQCRIDTMMAGLFQEPRPRCWYAGSH